ncbi:MAG: thiamine phosphate synthase [Vicinamibacterales bacterium]
MPVGLPRLYAIVDVEVCARTGRPPRDVAAGLLDGGARLLQVRAKSWSGGALLALVDVVQALAAPVGARVVVNDRVDVAGAASAGVHVGQADLPPAVARRLLGPAALIGCSTHTADELTAGLAAPVDYLAYGPVFPTASKARPDPVVGLDGVRAAADRAAAAGRPLVAIGGITVDTAGAVIDAGADAVAVIADLIAHTEPPAQRARRFLMALGERAG